MNNPALQDEITERAASLGEAAKNKLHEVQETAEELYEKGMMKARELESSLESYIRERPIQALLIATGISLGAGLCIGALIKRS